MKTNSDEVRNFGAWLADARAKRGITLDALASATKVSRSTIINLEQQRARGLNASTKHALEAYFRDDVAVGALRSMRNNGLEHLREVFEKIAEIILSSDFMDRVDGVAKMLRVSKKDAIVCIIEADLRK